MQGMSFSPFGGEGREVLPRFSEEFIEEAEGGLINLHKKIFWAT